jgi:lipoate---protein ligase
MPPLRVGTSAELVAEGMAAFESLITDPTPALRWYRSTDTAIVLGRGQRALPGPVQGGLAVLQRPSGGGAVLMAPDLLSCDVLVPAGHPLLAGDLGAVFLRVGRSWAAALEDVGVPAAEVYDGPAKARRSGNERQQLLAAVCFATLGRGEVTVGGRKLVGLAQRRRRHGALVQCGLLRRWDPGPLLELLGGDRHDREIAEAAVGLDALVEPPPADEHVMESVARRLTAQVVAEQR